MFFLKRKLLVPHLHLIKTQASLLCHFLFVTRLLHDKHTKLSKYFEILFG